MMNPRSASGLKNLLALLILAALGTVASYGLERKAAAPSYTGSSFRQIRSLVFDSDNVHSSDPVVEAERDLYRAGELPFHPVTWKSLWRKTTQGLRDMLPMRAKKTVNEFPDYYDRLEKLVHPTGICFTGEWKITENTAYDGYFATGAKGLFIGRASTANGQTRMGTKRTFGFAGKIFPTEDPDEVVRTLNFVTIDNLGGTRISRFMDTALTNEPFTGFAITPILSLEIFFAFSAADHNITFRPVTPIAEYGLPAQTAAHSPIWLMVKAGPGMPRVDADDFRHELDISHYPDGLVLDLYGSNTTHNPDIRDQWALLGNIQLRESTVSYGCDRQLHFHHNKIGL